METLSSNRPLLDSRQGAIARRLFGFCITTLLSLISDILPSSIARGIQPSIGTGNPIARAPGFASARSQIIASYIRAPTFLRLLLPIVLNCAFSYLEKCVAVAHLESEFPSALLSLPVRCEKHSFRGRNLIVERAISSTPSGVNCAASLPRHCAKRSRLGHIAQ